MTSTPDDSGTSGEIGHDGDGPSQEDEEADLVGVRVTRNDYCTFGCFAGCTFTSVCWAEGPQGHACARACTVPALDEAGCAALIDECLLEDGIACEG